MKRTLQAITVLLVFGVAKLPLEQRVTGEMRRLKMLDEPIQLGVGESIGQAGLAASLGGLRGLAACILQLRAHLEFTNVNWAKVDSLYKLVTRLQPRTARYWEEASWHMAYNAASYYRYNQALKPALRERFFQDHVLRGVAILQEGLQVLPQNSRLWQKLAETHWHKTLDFKAAGDAYLQSARNGGLNFTERFAGFAYARSSDPGAWKTGYAILKRYYDADKATPGLVQHLKMLEEKLGIPAVERIPDATPEYPVQRR